MSRSRINLRGWIKPLLLVALAVSLTVPWTLWVLRSANERYIDRNIIMLQRRIELQLGGILRFTDSERPNIWKTLLTELLSDPSVQAVCVFDKSGAHALRRDDKIPTPDSPGDINRLLNADANSIRRKLPWTINLSEQQASFTKEAGRQVSEAETRQILLRQGIGPDLIAGYTYVDLSRAQLDKQFREWEGPLLKRVLLMTNVVVLLLSAVGIFAHYGWQRLRLVTHRAKLEQQGMIAERGLTAAVLAHEIRNPLAALRFQLHSLRRSGGDEAKLDSTCEMIDGELSRIQQLVQDYLAYERAESMRIGMVDLTDAVNNLRTIMDEMLRSSETQLVVSEPEHPVAVRCDPHALRQVLMNLVLNAQQAMGREGRIVISIGRENEFGTIDVADNGPGIPEEMRERLFKPFQTTKAGGTGIGLALVKRFVDNFGGSVSVLSQKGEGTCFHLRLPLAGKDDLPVLELEPDMDPNHQRQLIS